MGALLSLVQDGLDPTDWKPMSSVGPGVREIRVRAGGQFRALYITTFAEAIYVLHVFEKRSQRTPARDIELGRARLARVVRERRSSR